MIGLIALICLGNIFVEGCVNHPKKNDTNKTPDETFTQFRSNLADCLEKDKKRVDVRPAINFFAFHSKWFNTMYTKTCTSDETAKCWNTGLKNIIPTYTDLHSDLVFCITKVEQDLKPASGGSGRAGGSGKTGGKRARREITVESKVRTKRSVEDMNLMFACPELSPADFKTKVSANSISLPNSDDNSLTKIDEVAVFFKKYVRCSNCKCSELKSGKTSSTNATGCQHCWYARLAAATRQDSPFYEHFVSIAMTQSQTSNIVCLPSPRITLNFAEIEKMEVNNNEVEKSLYLGNHSLCSSSAGTIDSSCFAKKVTSAANKNKTIAVFDLKDKAKSCGGKAKEVNGKLVYSYVVTKVPQLSGKSIDRYSCSSVEFQCDVPMKQTASLGPISSTVKNIAMTKITGSSNYKLEFTLTSAAPVEVNQPISAKITLKNVADQGNYKLLAGKCWASSTSATEYATTDPKHDIIDCHGCKNPQDTTINVMKNGVDQTVEFSVNAFTWSKNVTEQKIYLHCEVSVHDTSDGASFTKTTCAGNTKQCPTYRRFRRGVSNEDKTLLTFGPIEPFYKPQGLVVG